MNNPVLSHRVQKFHPLMPQAIARPGIARWLKKLHAWVGVSSIFAAIIFAYTGFALNHRADMTIGKPVQETEFTLPLPASGITNVHELADFVRFDMDLREPDELIGPGEEVPIGLGVGGDNRMIALFDSARQRVRAVYLPGQDSIEIFVTERPMTRMLNQMHMGNGGFSPWVWLLNAYTAALMFLSVTGLLIWSNVSGSAKLGGMLFLMTTTIMLYFFLPAL